MKQNVRQHPKTVRFREDKVVLWWNRRPTTIKSRHKEVHSDPESLIEEVKSTEDDEEE